VAHFRLRVAAHSQNRLSTGDQGGHRAHHYVFELIGLDIYPQLYFFIDATPLALRFPFDRLFPEFGSVSPHRIAYKIPASFPRAPSRRAGDLLPRRRQSPRPL